MGLCLQRWARLPWHTRVPACTCQHLHVPAHVPAATSQAVGFQGELLFSSGAQELSAQHGCRLGFGLFGLTDTRLKKLCTHLVSSRTMPWSKATSVGQILSKAQE